ncbi:MAG: sigma-70 family RNA polymerase sigma factor [Rhodobacteraceae bacterium]|nr:sigma-70 family RNA polymerase sigma factor [Paracoccaceae bacterium]
MKSKPVNNLEDLQLVDNIKKDKKTEDCLQELIGRHTGIYLDIVNKYTSNGNVTNRLDLIDEKAYNIYQAALKYEGDKGTKFPTFLGNETKWICLNKFNKRKKDPQLSIDDVKESDILHPKKEKIKKEDLEVFSEAIKLSKTHKDKRVEKIFEMRYITGEKNKVMPWKKISEELNMSIQGCINIHNSAVEKFKIELKDKDYV